MLTGLLDTLGYTDVHIESTPDGRPEEARSRRPGLAQPSGALCRSVAVAVRGCGGGGGI